MDTDVNAPRYGIGGQSTAGRVEGALFDEGLRRHMLVVYNYMGFGLVVTGLVAIVVGITPSLYVPIFSTPLKWVVILAPLPFAFLFAGRIRSMSATTAQALFWIFCAVMGLSLASIFLVFTGTSIARTFFIAAAMFGATSLYGYTTRRDLSSIGSFLIMGPDRCRDRESCESLHCVERAPVGRIRCRHHRIRWTNRVGYTID